MGDGRGSGASPSCWGGGGEGGEEVCHIFLAGNRTVHLCNPRFFGGKSRKTWFGAAIVVAFPKHCLL